MNDARSRLASLLATAAVLAAASAGCAGAPPGAGAAAPVSLDGHPHLTVRIHAGAVWTSARAWTAPRRAWTSPARGPAEQVALRALAAGGFEVTFRQGGMVWRGELDEDRAPRTPLTAVSTASLRDGVPAKAPVSSVR